jgi:hypothetical protein
MSRTQADETYTCTGKVLQYEGCSTTTNFLDEPLLVELNEPDDDSIPNMESGEVQWNIARVAAVYISNHNTRT